MEGIKKYIVVLACLFEIPICSVKSENLFTLSDAIKIAQSNSFDAQLARFSYKSSYWTYRSFLAELKPSVNLQGDLMNFDHSKVEARNFEDGKINYVDNNSLNNALTLSIDQQITSLGGVLSLQSVLNHLYQFDYKTSTFYSQPFRISYTQPLRTYNEMKWRKKSSPKEFDKAKRNFLEAMEEISIQTTRLFFSAIIAQANHKQNVSKYEDLKKMYELSQKRQNLGTITKSDLLQLELSMLNAQVALTSSETEMEECLFDLFSYLRIGDYKEINLVAPNDIPNIIINSNDALQIAIKNSSNSIEQELTLLTAKQNLAQAKSAKGIQMQLSLQAGISNTADNFKGAYSHMKDNEIIGLTLSMPIFDWGVQKGRVKVAESNLELAKTQMEQKQSSYIQEMKRQVIQFNLQSEQCKTSQRAQDISIERYHITKKRFEAGNITVTDLNTAMQEQESAKYQYLSQLEKYWVNYYTLKKSTLYDWIGNYNVTADFDRIINMK